jgi:hypothetical protein
MSEETTEHPEREGAPPNDGPLEGAPGPSTETDRDEDESEGDAAPTGLPTQSYEAEPLGTTEEAPDGEGRPRRGENSMPGIPTGGEPPSAG